MELPMKSMKLTILALCAGFSVFAGGDHGKDWNPYQYRHEPRDLYEGALFTGLGTAGWGLFNSAQRSERNLWEKLGYPKETFKLKLWERAVRAPFIAGTALGALLMSKYYVSNWKQIKNDYTFEYNRKFRKQ